MTVLKLINLVCPHCLKSKMVERDESDPPNAVRVEVYCPKCFGGDFSDVSYYDKDGNEVFQE